MKKTKVLLCAPSPSNKGGICTWSKEILDYFTSSDSDDIELIHLPMDRSKSLTHLMSKRKRFWTAIKDYSRFPYKLWYNLSQKGIRIAHITSVGGWMGSIRDLIFIFICKLFKAKSIIHYHCGTIPKLAKQNNFAWRLQAFIIRHSSKVIVLDEKSKSTLEHKGYKNIYKVPNPLPKALYNNVPETARRKNSLLFVGHVVPQKGIFELLDAIKGMNDLHLNVFGPHDTKVDEWIKKKVDENGLTENVKFHGIHPSDVIYENMRNSALFVLPTYTEGFPLVIMEAMACGCPIIATPVGAIKEMLETKNGIAGYLIPPKNTETLREQILYCLHNPDDTNNKALMAKEKVYTTYTLERVIKVLKAVWLN